MSLIAERDEQQEPQYGESRTRVFHARFFEHCHVNASPAHSNMRGLEAKAAHLEGFQY